jgi:hypothetical protein
MGVDVGKYICFIDIFTVLNEYNMIKSYIITLLKSDKMTDDWNLI